MALFFAETIRAAAAEEVVGLALLVRLGFLEGEKRLWSGPGEITLGGEVWQSVGEFGSISTMSSGPGDAASSVTFTLSGIDEQIYALATAGATTIKGRPAEVSLQFAGAGGVLLDSPAVIWIGRMSRMSADADAQIRSVNLICENRFTNRSKPPAGLYTDRDQQARFPGDLGLSFAASLIFKAVNWPSS